VVGSFIIVDRGYGPCYAFGLGGGDFPCGPSFGEGGVGVGVPSWG